LTQQHLIPNSSRVAATVTAPVHALHRHGGRDALRRETALFAQSLRLGQECHFGISCSSRTTGCNSSSSIFGTVVAIGSAIIASLGAQIDHSAIRSMTAIKHAFTIQETNLLTLAARGQIQMILLALRYWTQMEQKRECSLAHTERTACVCVCFDVCCVQSNAWQKRSQICFTFKGRYKPLWQAVQLSRGKPCFHTQCSELLLLLSDSVALLCTSKESKRDTREVACVRVFDLEHRHGSNGILQTRHDSFHE
jgi:hypothetical protein